MAAWVVMVSKIQIMLWMGMNGLSLGNTLLGRGASSNWRCNDCFESGSIELDEGKLDELGSNKYTYYDPESSNGEMAITHYN